MKYQYILNNTLVFETNDVQEYFQFLIGRADKQVMYRVLYNLLEKYDGYICNVVTG